MDIFKILQSLKKSGNWQSDCIVQRKVIFRLYISKQHKCFDIKIYKLCDANGYLYDTKLYLEKDRQHMTAAGEKTEQHGHKLYMDSSFSFLKPVNEVTKKKINFLGMFG